MSTISRRIGKDARAKSFSEVDGLFTRKGGEFASEDEG